VANRKILGASGGSESSREERNQTMHSVPPIGSVSLVMASDIIPTIGSQIHRMWTTESKNESDRLFSVHFEGVVLKRKWCICFWMIILEALRI